MNKCYMEANGIPQNAGVQQNRFPCCFGESEVEKNIAKTEAKQIFEFGPISGSVIAGAVTNNQIQVAVSLAFDEIEIEI